jgi:hypothetical protein
MGEKATPRTVMEMIRRDDTERSGRMRYLYEVDLTDPSLYDLVLNMEKLTVPTAVEMIAGAVERPELQTTDAGAQLVADRSLASRVQVALATHPETRKYRITVEAKAGRSASREQLRWRSLTVTRGVPGVRGVKAEQVDIPPIPPFVA